MPKRKKHEQENTLNFNTEALGQNVDKSSPTYKFANSVVKISNTSLEYNYEEPWQTPGTSRWGGSGFVIEGNYIITNAHVAENSKHLTLRLAEDDEEYEAEVKCIGHDCDLALLTVQDKEFWKNAKPLSLGEMVHKEQDVRVVGFPIGGGELCTNKGIVSRVEVGGYSHSMSTLLQAQTDAAINSGNSGGPVFDSTGKVVGVAFQGFGGMLDSTNYMIPIPVISHFLDEALNNEKYLGFPQIGFSYQKISNPSAMRDELGMSKDQTGVIVKDIDKLAFTHGILKKHDVILAIDDIKVKNDATVALNFDKRVKFLHLFSMKNYNDNIKLTVLRKGKQLELDIKIISTPGGTKYVMPYEREKDPTYYISSGVVFQPVTANYLETEDGCELLEGEIDEDEAKEKANEQLIIINRVLDCKKTSGYAGFSNTVVKSINGKKISNMTDVIAAIEGEPDRERMVVKCKNKKLLVVEKMSKKEHAKLLNEIYRIPRDRSLDLEPASHNKEKSKVIAITEDKPIFRTKTPSETKEEEDAETIGSDTSSDCESESDDESSLDSFVVSGDGEDESGAEEVLGTGYIDKLVGNMFPKIKIDADNDSYDSEMDTDYTDDEEEEEEDETCTTTSESSQSSLVLTSFSYTSKTTQTDNEKPAKKAKLDTVENLEPRTPQRPWF